MLQSMRSQRIGHNLATEQQLVAEIVKNPLAVWKTQVQSVDQEDPLDKGMGIYSSILAWRIPWTQELGRLYSPWGREESDVTE